MYFNKIDIMKKVIFILITVLTLGTVANAQSKVYVQPTVATQNAVFSQGLEIGFQTGKDRAAIIGQTFNGTNDDRQYFAGFKYGRVLHQGSVLDVVLTAAALAHVDHDIALSLEPGAEANLKFGEHFALVGGVTSPLYQGQTPFKSLNLKGAAGLKITF